MPPNTKLVTRATKWGNPFKVKDVGTHQKAVELFEAALLAGQLPYTVVDVKRELAGWDIACECPLHLPCHGDVLLRIADE